MTLSRHALVAFALGTVGLGAPVPAWAADPLPSWSDGPSKQAILKFVADVTSEGAPGFVPAAERIATFDNDGTLWSEQPIYFQFAFALDRVKAMAPQHPEWQAKEPFKTLLAGDVKGALGQGEKALLEILAATHTGMTTEEFAKTVTEWTINRFIGRRPILAFGNSDGDHAMLQWTAAGGGRRFMGIVHHTDADREWAYDRQSHVGKLDKALDEALSKGWTVVDMKKDWKRVYPFDKP
jgi:hypothetical protein